MDRVSRPLLIALVAVVALAGLWLAVLKPHSSSSSSAPAKPLASAPPVAKGPAVDPRPVRHAPSHRVPRSAANLQAVHQAKPVTHTPVSGHSPAGRLSAVQRAMARGHVLALLFYNPGAADDQAVRQELASVPGDGGKVFKLAIPLSELSSYAQLTNQVPVNVSPTLVIVGRTHQAQEIVGFADSFEISQRLQDALGS